MRPLRRPILAVRACSSKSVQDDWSGQHSTANRRWETVPRQSPPRVRRRSMAIYPLGKTIGALGLGQRNGSRTRAGRSGIAGAPPPIQPRIHTAPMSRREVEKTFVVRVAHAEQRHESAVVATRRNQSLAHQLAHVVTCNVAAEKQPVYLVPKRKRAADKTGVQIICQL